MSLNKIDEVRGVLKKSFSIGGRKILHGASSDTTCSRESRENHLRTVRGEEATMAVVIGQDFQRKVPLGDRTVVQEVENKAIGAGKT